MESNMEKHLQYKRYGSMMKRTAVNLAILIVVLIGLESIVHTLPFRFRISGSNYCFFSPRTLSLHKSFSAITGFVLIYISYRLYKRVRTAWMITLCLILISLLLHVSGSRGHITPIEGIELFILLFLVICHKDFQRTANPISLKVGILLAFISVFLVILNTITGLLLLKPYSAGWKGFSDVFMDSLQLLFFMDVSYIEPKTRTAAIFGQTEIILNWASITSALFFILKPLLYQPIITKIDRDRVNGLLSLYGNNPTSYVAIEEDKKYFFGNAVEGVIAYVTAGNVAVCAGDPVCRKEDTPFLLREFILSCKQNNNDICFCQVMPENLSDYRGCGFGITKYGEEAMFELDRYELSGGKAAKLRNAINHAEKLGIGVVEYKPAESRDKYLEEQIHEISKEWLEAKKSGEMSFMLGSISLSNPLGRRYFIALDPCRKALGFVVFVPFSGGKGYMADVTRRRKDAPIGVMETIIISSFRTMQKEGVLWGSLGLAPLHNVENDEAGQKSIAGSMLKYVYENMNHFYGFKSLYHYKKKFSPTSWEPRYLAYYPNVFTPKIAYSIIKAQNPKGVKEYLLIQLKKNFSMTFHPSKTDCI